MGTFNWKTRGILPLKAIYTPKVAYCVRGLAELCSLMHLVPGVGTLTNKYLLELPGIAKEPICPCQLVLLSGISIYDLRTQSGTKLETL